MLVNLGKIKQFYFKSSKTQYNTSSQFNKPWIHTNHTKSNSSIFATAVFTLRPSSSQKRQPAKKKKPRNSQVNWSLIFETVYENKEKKQLSHSHTHTCKSTAQCSHLSRCHPTASLTGFILEPHWRVNCHSLITLKTSNHRQTYFSLTGTRITRNINWPTTYRAHTEVVLIPIHLNITCNIAAQKCN